MGLIHFDFNTPMLAGRVTLTLQPVLVLEPVTQAAFTASCHALELAGQEVVDMGLELIPVQGLWDSLLSAVREFNFKHIPNSSSQESLSQAGPNFKARNYTNLPLEAQPRFGPWVPRGIKLFLKNFQ